MARKRNKPEEIVAKLRQVDVLVSQGQSMTDAIRQIGVSEVTYYRWRQATPLQYGQAQRITRLQTNSTEGVRARPRRVAGCATSTGSAGHAGAQANLS